MFTTAEQVMQDAVNFQFTARIRACIQKVRQDGYTGSLKIMVSPVFFRGLTLEPREVKGLEPPAGFQDGYAVEVDDDLPGMQVYCAST
jgi:hypothetical protein